MGGINGLVLAVIVAIFGGLAIVLFGKPKGSEQQESDRVERVESSQPIPTPLPTIEQPPISSKPVDQLPATQLPATAEASSSITTEIADPWADEPEVKPEELLPVQPLVAAQAPGSQPPGSEVPARSEHPTEITTKSTFMPPFAAIHDPKRPSTPELQDLSQEILSMGASQQLRFVPKLVQYANHSDPMIRSYVAYALGQIAAPHTVKAEIEAVIPVLGKLTQDSNLEVRKMAMKALSVIQSPKVLPYLEKGLLSSAGAVKQIANTAIQKLKLQYESKPTDPQFPPALQKKQ